MTIRKPYNSDAGYVCSLKSKHPKLPGHFVIYDRDADPSPGIDADHRWIVTHMPSTHHVSVPSQKTARELMKAAANGSDVVDFGQHETPTPTPTPYQPKTGQACGCRPGVERDNCPACEGTGHCIDFAAIRSRNASN